MKHRPPRVRAGFPPRSRSSRGGSGLWGDLRTCLHVVPREPVRGAGAWTLPVPLGRRRFSSCAEKTQLPRDGRRCPAGGADPWEGLSS